MVNKRIAALIEDARSKGMLPADAEVKAAGICQNLFSPYWFLLIAPILLLAVIRQRLVLATDTDLYVLRTSFWKSKQAEGVEFTEPLAEADLRSANGYSFKVEGNETLYPMLFQASRIKQIGELATAARGAAAGSGGAAAPAG